MPKSRLIIGPMLRTRIITALIFAPLVALPLHLLGIVRYKYHYSPLIEIHKTSGINFELPLFIQILWPFAAVRWWSYLTPIAIGIGIASRLRHPLSTIGLSFSLGGVILLWSVVLQSFLLFAKLVSYMGNPVSDPIEPNVLAGNVVLIGGSLCFAFISVSKLIATYRQKQNPPPATSGS